MKALTQFPSVLDNLAKNLAWTSALGEASATQQPDVMAAVQRMRAKAQAAGNLKSSPEIKVVQESPQTIVIQPANPQIVYVPVYNPAVIYGVPYVYPGLCLCRPAPIDCGDCFRRRDRGRSHGVWRVLRVGLELLGHQLAQSHHHLQSQRLRRKQLLAWWLLRWRLSSRIPCVSSRRLPGYRPGYPGYGRPPAISRQSSSRYNSSANAGNRPNAPGGGSRPGGDADYSAGQSREPSEPDSELHRPSTNEARGYQRPQTSNTGATQAARPNAFSGSAGGRAQSARGNQSMAAKGGRGVASGANSCETRVGLLLGEVSELVR